MESLETAALMFDNLLDFSSDIGEEDDDDPEKKKNLLPLQTTIESNNNSAELTISDSDTHHASFPGMVEEELEWLSNEDAFPPIETFDILSVKPDIIPKNQSPVSVLGNNSSIRVPLKVPVKARSKRRRKKRSSFSDLLGQQWWYNYEPKKESVAAKRMWRASSSGRKCLHCQADKTPQWRAGPLGPKTLCNACGVRYKSGRLLPEYRPASSPTFSEQLHSNSHRKILDMRKQKQKDVYFESPDQEVFFQSSDKGFETMKKSLRATRMSTTTLSVRRCQHCPAERTSEWIEEPFGPKTFCNACGMIYRSDCSLPEYRPVNSPSFNGELHSNFHTKMLDVRRQKQKEMFLQSSYEGRCDLLGS